MRIDTRKKFLAGKATRVFFQNAIAPLQQRLQAVNSWLGQAVVRFSPYIGEDGSAV